MEFIDTRLVPFLHAAIASAVPFIFAGLGEVIAERSGVVNIGIEGIMVFGAFLGFAGVYLTGSPLLGLLLAAAGGAVLGLLMAFLTVTLRLNQIIVGLALFFVGFGLGGYANKILFPRGTPPSIPTLGDMALPLLSQIPVLGPVLFDHDVLAYAALALVPLCWYVLYRTRLGLEIRATGESPAVADSLGINVFLVRYGCVIAGAVLAAWAGAYLTQAESGRFQRLIVGGRGFISIAVVIVALWNPWRVLLGALIFAGGVALQFRAQLLYRGAPAEILLMAPYVLTIVALVVIRLVGHVSETVPAGLGQNYARGGEGR
ncbi:MAG: ABC transporter permease [Deinococcus sp.]|nr:ABC transporter permease [Deinococcus sp.]